MNEQKNQDHDNELKWEHDVLFSRLIFAWIIGSGLAIILMESAI